MSALLEKKKRARLDLIQRQQDTAKVDAVERKAFEHARPHLAEFQIWCDQHNLAPNFIELVAAWWKERGIVGEWYMDKQELKSKWVARAEDVT